jgi:hypothetical protein
VVVSELQEETHHVTLPQPITTTAQLREEVSSPDVGMTPVLPRIEDLEEVKFAQSEILTSKQESPINRSKAQTALQRAQVFDDEDESLN